MSPLDEQLLSRTRVLARLGGSAVSPNPQVGAVLAVGDTIVSEGWHQRYGGPHAEVNCLVPVTDPHVLARATLYVSLEPCTHHGKTPPCTELILAKGIRRVVIGCPDPNPKVAGGGIEQLRNAGVEVLLVDDPTPYQSLIRAFTVRQRAERPYLILKWAQTADGKMGKSTGSRLIITGTEAGHYTHELRARADAIAIGWRTAVADDPRLTLRHYPGQDPRIVVFDPDNELARYPDLKLKTGTQEPIVLNGLEPLQLQLAELHHRHQVGTLLVEGGLQTLRGFLELYLWDELHVITGPIPAPEADVLAPALPQLPAAFWQTSSLGPDRLLRTFAPLT